MTRLRAKLMTDPGIAGTYAVEDRDPLFSDFADAYLEVARRNKRSWKRDEYSVAHLAAFFGRRRLSQISPILIEKYKISREATQVHGHPLSLATLNRELACLKTILAYAIDNNKTVTFPLKRIKIDLKAENKRERFLDRSEEERLIAAAAKHLKPMITLATNTGMRVGEIKKLRREHISFGERMITIPVENAKSKKARRVPMNTTVLELLRSLAPADGGFIFHKGPGEPFKNIAGGFKAAAERAEIKGAVFHTLRHTFITRELNLGVPEAVVSMIVGHEKSSMTYGHYYHADDDVLLAAVEKLVDKPAEKPIKNERSDARSQVFAVATISKQTN